MQWVQSSQHKEMLIDLEKFFGIKTHCQFDIKRHGDLCDLASQILIETDKFITKEKPDLILLQGDTMTAQQVALAAFYHKIPIAHIEAGIRTYDIHSPFPEELSRRILTQIAVLNFAPTQNSYNNLEAEKILNKNKTYNFLTGNTVIDTLQLCLQKINSESFIWGDYKFVTVLNSLNDPFDNFPTSAISRQSKLDMVEFLRRVQNDDLSRRKIILVTAHRRENIDQIHLNLANAIYRLAKENKNLEFIIAVHKNPETRKPFAELSSRAKDESLDNIKCVEPINYPLFLKLMQEAFLIVTDSGGVQEEAAHLSKPILVCRKETERVEGVKAGIAKLIDTEETGIYNAILDALNRSPHEVETSRDLSLLELYGDGKAAQRIAEVCKQFLDTN